MQFESHFIFVVDAMCTLTLLGPSKLLKWRFLHSSLELTSKTDILGSKPFLCLGISSGLLVPSGFSYSPQALQSGISRPQGGLVTSAVQTTSMGSNAQFCLLEDDRYL